VQKFRERQELIAQQNKLHLPWTSGFKTNCLEGRTIFPLGGVNLLDNSLETPVESISADQVFAPMNRTAFTINKTPIKFSNEFWEISQ
jgi:hypothetical protein